MELIVGRGNAYFEKDVEIDGDLFANLVYGEMYNETENGYTVSIGAVDTWYNVTNLVLDEVNNVSFSSNSLVVDFAGVYKVDTSVSFSGTANSVHEIGVLVNGLEHDACSVFRKLGGAGDVGNAGSSCLVTLSGGDFVSIGVSDIDASADNIAVWNANINLLRVG